MGAGISLLRIKSDLETGRDRLADLSLERLDGGLAQTIAGASSRLERAHERARDNVFLKPLSVLPLVGDQVDAVRDLTAAAAVIGRAGQGAADRIDGLVERAAAEPAARIELLVTLRDELDVIEDVVDDVKVGAEGRLIGPLEDARRDLVAQLDGVPARFDDARDYLAGLTDLLTGPTRYLVLAANSAEMRGGAGMPLQGGVLTIAGGDLDFGDFEPLGHRPVPVVDSSLLPPEWAKAWSNYKMGSSWVQTAVSPNFESTAPVYAAMSERFPTGPVDGVIEVDAVALASILRVIGPVELAGTTYTADNIVSKVLYENYLAFDSLDERSGRQEQQGQIAKAVFDAIKTRDVEIGDLSLALREMATSRHFRAWSRDPNVQELWNDLGATGGLPDSSLMVTVQNISGNKLDYFIKPQVLITAVPDTLVDAWKVRVTVVIENPAGVRTNQYIDGLRPELPGGQHRTMVALFFPKGAFGVRTLDGQPITDFGVDPPVNMVAQRFTIARGQTVRPGFEFNVPTEQIGALIIPSGRIEPVPYTINGTTVTDATPFPIFWGTLPSDDEGPGAAGIAALLCLLGALTTLVGVRARMRVVAVRPIPALGVFAQRAPSLAGLLYLAALGTLIAGALIAGTT